jgi:hypothetical protein
MFREVQITVVRDNQLLLRQVSVDVDGFGEHIVCSVAPVDDLTGAERQEAEDRAALQVAS